MYDEKIASEIGRLEYKIWIWAIIYYRFGDSLVTDREYDLTSKKLQRMTQEYPEEFKNSRYYSTFKDFSWVSGYDLPLYDIGMTSEAEFILCVTKYGYEKYKEIKIANNMKYK